MIKKLIEIKDRIIKYYQKNQEVSWYLVIISMMLIPLGYFILLLK